MHKKTGRHKCGPVSYLHLYYFFVGKILYMPVPHFEHVPFTARRPFFPKATSFHPSAISLFALHFTQYPSMLAMMWLG
jgi:hypothetical protein